jgi:hypothetical protein
MLYGGYEKEKPDKPCGFSGFSIRIAIEVKLDT